jgi:hypothetical protein
MEWNGVLWSEVECSKGWCIAVYCAVELLSVPVTDNNFES